MVEVTGKPFDEASKEAALKLLKYVGGSNDKGEMLAGQLLWLLSGSPIDRAGVTAAHVTPSLEV